MLMSSPRPSPPLPNSPGSLSHSSSSTATSSSSNTSSFERSPPSSAPFSSAAKTLPWPSPFPAFAPQASSPPPQHGAHSSTRYPLAVSPSAKRSRALSAASPAPANTNTNTNALFTPTLSQVPQALDDGHSLTAYAVPATPAAAAAARAGPPARRQSSAPYAAGGVQPAGLSSATSASAPAGAEGANQLEAKVVILGSQGVGKTSIVHRYTSGHFSYSLTSTIGASFLTKRLVVDGCKVRLQLWDTAGQERFRSMAPLYYRGALAAILVYDITNMASFNDVKVWLDELRRNMSPDLIIHVVGSKVDLAPTLRAVDLDYARRSVAEWVMGDDSAPPTPRSREPSPPSPARPRTRTMSTRGLPSSGAGGLTTSASLPVITTTRSDPPAPTLGARVRKMSAKLGAPAPPSCSSAGGNSSSASSVSDAGLGASSHTLDAPSSGMVRSGSKLGLTLGLGKSSSRGRRSNEEDRKSHEDLERERVDAMVRDCGVEVSEVSGKDDFGIEDLFLDITRRLVERKAQIETARVLRSRDSVMIRDSDSPAVASGGMCC